MLAHRVQRREVPVRNGLCRGMGRHFESLERRTLLNAAPVAGNDSYQAVAGHVLSVADELPPNLVLVAQSAEGHIYGAVVGSSIWPDARRAAGNMTYKGAQGHLVTFNSAAEHTFVLNEVVAGLASEFNAGDIWIGLSDISAEGSFRWVTNEPLTFTAWAGGEPNNSGNEDVVEMYTTGVWNDINVNDQSAAYIVEFDGPFADGVLADDTDADDDPLTATLVSDAAHGALALAADGSFTYLADPEFSGTDTFTYRASDGQAQSNLATVTIEVAPNQAPVAVDDAFEMVQDATLSIGNRLPEGVTPVIWGENGHAYMQVNEVVNWAEAVAGASSWEYQGVTGHLISLTSAAENDFLVNNVLQRMSDEQYYIGLSDLANEGEFVWVTGEPLTFSFWNGGEPNNSGGQEDVVELYTIFGNRWNDVPPSDFNAGYFVEFDAPHYGGVLRNDFDADGDPLQAELVDDVQHGVLALEADGTFTYAPDAGFIGEDAFTYRVSDGAGGTSTATATIDVLRFNSAPTAAYDVYYTPVNETRAISAAGGVLVNDLDAEDDALSAELLEQPQFGGVVLQPDGSFVYTPAADFVGTDWFKYQAADFALTSKPTTVTILVTEFNDTPVARDDAYSVDEDGELIVDASPQASVLQISQPSRDLVYDVSGNLLYVSMGNDLTPIDPVTGQSGTPFTIGQQPGGIVISDDGRYIYAAVNDGRNVKRFDTNTGLVDVSWQIGDFSQFSTAIGDMEAVPGNPNAVAIQQFFPCCSPRAGGVMVFEDGVLLPKHTAGGLGTSGGGDSIAFAAPGLLLGYTNTISSFGLTQMQVDETGVTPTLYREGLISGFDKTITAGGGKVYSSGGTVIDAVQLRVIGQLPVGGQIVPDPNYNRVLVLSGSGASLSLHALDADTNEEIAVIRIPGVAGEAGDLTVLGPGDFAFRTNGGKVVLIHSDELAGQPGRGVLSNDFDPEGDAVTASVVTTTQHGALTLNADGTITYVPDPNFFGEDSFTYQASDGTHTSAPATVRIQVRGSNDVPVAQPDEYRIREKLQLVVSAATGVLSNDADYDGQPLVASVLTNPTRGTLQLSANGGFFYTPGPSFTDGDSFVYRAFDGQVHSAPVTVNIIYDVPRIAVGDHTLLANAPDQTIQIFVSGAHAVSGLNLYLQVGDGGPERTQYDLPPGKDGPAITGIDIKSGAVFSGVPDAGFIDLAIPQVASAILSIAEPNGAVSADGLLATVTLDTTGLFGGTWDLLLNNVLAGFLGGPFATDFAGVPAIIGNGTLIIEEATITARQVSYAGSEFGDEPATDKQALLPGQTATFANYTSYVQGINGLAVDIADALGTPTLDDFAFHVGTSSNTATWQPAPAPSSFELLVGAGADGADRVVLHWPDGAISNQWLMVRIKSSVNTGLATDDVFYFGNAIGESGDSATNALVNATDVIGTRDNPHGPLNPAGIDDPYDFNRDRLVNATDLVIARDHNTSPLSALRLITPNGAPPASPPLRNGPTLDRRAKLAPAKNLAAVAAIEKQRRGLELAALDAVFAAQDLAPTAGLKRRSAMRRS